MPRFSISRQLTAVLLSAVVAAACGDAAVATSPAVAPSLSPVYAQAKAPGQKQEGFQGTACTTRKAVHDSGSFGPAGGTLVFGDSKLIIPSGALTTTVFITAHTFGDSTSRVEFSPTGLQFLKAAGLVLGAAGCDIDESTVPNIVYLSPTGQVLETIQAVYDPRWKTVAAPIVHFSGYAIAF